MYFGAAHPRGSSPITIFAGVGDFGAPAVAMRGAGLGQAGNYEAYPFQRKFGTTYLNRPRMQYLGDAPAATPAQPSDVDKYIQVGVEVLGQIRGIVDAWGKANAAGQAQLAQVTAAQTGLSPAQVQMLLQQELAKQQQSNPTPAWVWPVVGVVGLAAVGGLVLALRR